MNPRHDFTLTLMVGVAVFTCGLMLLRWWIAT